MHAGTITASKPPHSGRCDIHNAISQVEELLALKGLSEEVGQVVRCVHIWHHNLIVLNTLAHEKMPARDMLDFLMVLRVISDVTGG